MAGGPSLGASPDSAARRPGLMARSINMPPATTLANRYALCEKIPVFSSLSLLSNINGTSLAITLSLQRLDKNNNHFQQLFENDLKETASPPC
jgi:hypothetical protein